MSKKWHFNITSISIDIHKEKQIAVFNTVTNMTQPQAVIDAIESLGGIAPLGKIYQVALQNPDCTWGTQTPQASIRRIVRHTKGIYVVRKGLYALESHRKQLEANGIVEVTSANANSNEIQQFTHYYYQGLLLKVGELRHLDTFVPNQDKNRMFLQEATLGDLRSLNEIPNYTYSQLVQRSSTIDVIWFNERKMPHSFFEVEHSTDIQNSLLKFCDLQDFNARMVIVADDYRKDEYLRKLNETAFRDLREQKRVSFLSYDELDRQYENALADSQRGFIL